MTDFLQNQQINSINHLNTMKTIAQQGLVSNEHSIDIHRLNKLLEAEREASNELAEDVMFYKSLLSRPMAEIAKYNVDFAATFEMQQQTMADWILSQKAYKELAMDLGYQAGISSDDVEKAYLERVSKIADDAHDYATMPDQYKPYAKNSAEHITKCVMNKLKKSG